MNAKEFRQKYIDFFKSKGHVEIPSASLVPQNDPSVLFNTAGMQPLVPYLLGEKHPLGKRIVNVQKCIRTVDFDSIGDNTHHTFFQMLGNWSLGDYFKKESISWSFEFLTDKKWLNIPLEKLAFTCFNGEGGLPRDTDAFECWVKLGVPKERIAFLGKEDNWWQAGPTGPCGPDTEIFYWTGREPAPKVFDPSDKRWVEIWNNVFMQYNKKEDGSLESLKNKNIDTGMGLERTLAILNGFDNTYDTDLFKPIIKEIEVISKSKYSENKKEFRIIADHLRASVFLLAEKVIPSNTERGYVLRRLIRRAIVYANKLGITCNFTNNIAKIVIKNYTELYSELKQNEQFILEELEKEEIKFRNTLEKGLKEFDRLSKSGLDGKNAFLLFQSYGFPIEMTLELAKEKNMTVDLDGYNEELKKHQELSRIGAEQKFKGGLADTSGETVKLHTASHLLNEALRRIVSKDIRQKGSNITPERLRFDFNLDRKLTDDEIKAVENEVNKIISQKLDVKREEMKVDAAFKAGAQGEFGAKYPEIVSVYTIGNYSKEICMGPHVSNISELGHLKIQKEESSSAGIRRIKAVLE